MKKLILILCFILIPAIVSAGTYTLAVDDDTFDGGTDCDGACDSSDTIIIAAGAHGDTKIRDLDGNGSYITVTNGDSEANIPATITTDENFSAGIALIDCQWVDFRGDGDPDVEYGIVVHNNDAYSQGIWVYPSSGNLSSYTLGPMKISYCEVYCSNITNDIGSGISTIYAAADKTVFYDTFEIHNNYIHDTGYAGMYLGQNDPDANDNPYTKDYSIHDNLLVDMGNYGITHKGVHSTSGNPVIYNNIVRPSDRSSGNSTGLKTTKTGEFHHGIGVADFESGPYAIVYHNYIEKTSGPGFKVSTANHKIYENTIVGCGQGDEADWGHGISTQGSAASGVTIYDNNILESKKYGVFGRGTLPTGGVTLSRNRIGDSGTGEWGVDAAGDIVESSGDDANVYEADIADLDYVTWEDNFDFSDDDLSKQFTVTSGMGTGDPIEPDDFVPHAIPGDTIIIESRPTQSAELGFRSFDGTSFKKYYFTNPTDSQCVINKTGNFLGIGFYNSDNFILDGSNYSSEFYGIEIDGNALGNGNNGTNGMRMRQCADWTIQNVYIHDCGGGVSQNDNELWGDTLEADWDDTDSMGDCIFRDIKIVDTSSGPDVGSEGTYFGKTDDDDGVSAGFPRFSSFLMERVWFEDTGSESVQIGQIEPTSGTLTIQDVYIKNAATDNENLQNKGISLSAGYKNVTIRRITLIGVSGNGLYGGSGSPSYGTFNGVKDGPVDIQDCLFVDTGNADSGTHGIQVTNDLSGNVISNNYLVIGSGDGIKTANGSGTLTDNLVFGVTGTNFTGTYTDVSGNTTFAPGDYFELWSNDSNFANDSWAPLITSVSPPSSIICSSDPRDVIEGWTTLLESSVYRIDTVDQSYTLMGSENDTDTVATDTISRDCGAGYTRYVRGRFNYWNDSAASSEISYFVGESDAASNVLLVPILGGLSIVYKAGEISIGPQ